MWRQHGLPPLGQDGKRRRVSSFQGHYDTAVRFQKHGHVRQRLTDRHRFDIGPRGQIALVGDGGQRLIGGRLKRIVLDLVPDGSVNAVGIARTRVGRDR